MRNTINYLVNIQSMTNRLIQLPFIIEPKYVFPNTGRLQTYVCKFFSQDNRAWETGAVKTYLEMSTLSHLSTSA